MTDPYDDPKVTPLRPRPRPRPSFRLPTDWMARPAILWAGVLALLTAAYVVQRVF